MEIGERQRTWIVEPIEAPVPDERDAPAPEPADEREPVAA
jgi:hypothetical protein